jgi:predicted Zn-dependent protease
MLQKCFLYTIFIFLSVTTFQSKAFSEYNLATGEEETLFISEASEIKMGRNIASQVEEKMGIDKNYAHQEKVDIIGQRLVKVCDRKDIIYSFKVIDDEKENAFALPGGYIYIFKGLLEKLDTDDEIAAILAHEVGHVCAKHSIKRLQNSMGYSALGILVSYGAKDNYSRRKVHEAIGHLMLAHSREDEFEADRLAVKYLKKAEYDQDAMLSVLDKLLKWQMEGPVRTKRYWYTHPYLAARRAAVRKETTGQMSFDDYMNVTEEEDYVIPY